ncbi:MAG TPA: GTPase HflX [Rubrobacteraceae bacterium]|nr:GTPase HflX [Rubrobacteraceae bacterium]
MVEGDSRMGDEEKAILVAAGEDRQLAELGRLAHTLGLGVVGELEQGRRDPIGYVGRGKREELSELVGRTGAGLVVTDDELAPSQARILEKASGATIVDRTLLIIRIFEAHARDAASRLEVELAELSYRLPRVRGGYRALSRLGGGGVTTRGPGEQQLEYDRRLIRERMERIRRRLSEERAAREVRGARLRSEGPPRVTLVGYTNAGKTTILNALSGEQRSSADRLFETLETTTRLVSAGHRESQSQNGGVPESRPDFVLTDTVGFIRKLPTQLVHSFAGTLEAVSEADVVVLCADASSEQLEEEIQTVKDTLSEVRREGEKPQETVLCLNKSDMIPEDRGQELAVRYPDSVLMSALRDARLLLDAVNSRLARSRVRLRLLIPHAEHRLVSALYGRAEIHERNDTTQGIELDVTLAEPQARRYAHYRTA